MSIYLKKSAAAAAVAMLSVMGVTSCGGSDLIAVDRPTLLTAAPPNDDEIMLDSAWGGTIDATQDCVTVVSGESRSVLVAPDGSSVMENSRTGDIILRVDGEDYPFDAEYRGGGISVEDADGEYSNIPGADECIASTDATDVVIIFTIESA